MKRVKDILYLIGVLFSAGMVLFLSTAIVQLGTEAIAKGLEVSLKDDFLFTVKNGSGLGLSISQKIIERHGGSLSYANDWKDGYKCFRIDLRMA